MSIQMQLWNIQEDRPVLLPSGHLDFEAKLEKWICQDLSLVGEDLIFLGSQVSTDYGYAVDILALDRDGNLVVLELKRGRTPRDVVAQILDYASWAYGLGEEEIRRMAEVQHHRPLEALYDERFQSEVPSLNEGQRLLIVAAELDARSERIVQYLAEQHGVNINVVFFDYYRHGDSEFIGRSRLISPGEVERKVRTLGAAKRRPLLSLEDVASIADERGVGEIYGVLHEELSALCDQVGTTQSNVTYRWRMPSGGVSALVSVYPKASSPELGLVADIRVDDLAHLRGLAPEDLRAVLPKKLDSRKIPGVYLYGEGYSFRNREDIARLVRAFGKAG